MKFGRTDFERYVKFAHTDAETIATVANAKLKEWLEQAPTVYGWNHKTGYIGEGDRHAKLDQEPHWRGYIVAREQIKIDTLESLWRELLKRMDNAASYSQCHEILDRARKLLQEEKCI